MRPRRLTARFGLAIAGLVIVSCGALGTLAITVSRQRVREQIEASNTTSAVLAARAVEQYVTVSVSIVEEAAQRPKLSREIRAANWPEVSRVLENIARHLPRFDYLFVQDRQGVIRARVPHAETVGQDFSFQEFFREAMHTRRSHVSNVYTSRAAQRPVVTIAVPVSDGGAGVAGVLCGALSVAQMSEFLVGIGGGHGTVVSVVDRRGGLVADSRGIRTTVPVRMVDEPIVRAVLAGRSGTMEFRSAGSDATLFGAYLPITRLGWGIVVGHPAATAYASVTRLAWGLAGIAFGCTLAAVLVGFVLTYRLTGPLRRVSEATQQLAAGNFRKAQVSVEGHDEVATLATAFNQMAHRIEASYQALEEKAAEVETANQALARELEERRQVEAALRGSNLTMRGLIQAAPLAIWVLDAEGRVQLWNPAAEQIFGWTEQEAVGQILPIVPEDRIEEFRGLFARTLRGETLPGLELRRQRKDGSLIPVSVAVAALYGAAGDVQGAISIVADLTERSRLEDQVRQLQKMEAIGSLAGGIAHDFNNLLTVIIGRSAVGLSQVSADDPVHRHLELIKRTADRAAALTQQLLAFSRKQVLQPKVLDLGAVVAGVAPILHRLIGEDVELSIVSGADLGPVRVDPGQIEQVVMNLAVNARDAMPHGGRLTIETANIDLPTPPGGMLDPVPAGSYVMLKVEDTGIGMDREIQRQIFEPFFTTKEVGRGTGLGLATVQGIVHQHGGAIRAYSAPGEGTTFKIYLPRVADVVAATSPPDTGAELLRGDETVLLVEDEPEVRDLARQVLESSGYTVLEACRGDEALAMCRKPETPLHLLVTDVVMPGMSGRELAERLTSIRPTMKVLFTSGYTDERLGRQGMLEPGVAFLPKPFTPADLARKVREALGPAGQRAT